MFVRRKNIVHLSAAFLLVFSGAFAVSALCDLGVIDYAANLTHQHDEEHRHDADHHHGEAASGHTGHHDTAHQHNGGHEDEACCEEIAGSLESGLFFYQLISPVPAVKYFLLQTIDFGTQSSPRYTQRNVIYHEYDDPPPLDGFRLRVVIQSFLN